MNKQTVTDPSQQYDLRILRALRRITRSIALHSRQLSAVSHITAPQLMCLRTVIANGPLTATAISREIHVSPSTVVGILDRLEDKGLIRRERGREDRRIVFVTATEAGRALAGCAVAAAETPGGRAERVAGTGAGHHHAVAGAHRGLDGAGWARGRRRAARRSCFSHPRGAHRWRASRIGAGRMIDTAQETPSSQVPWRRRLRRDAADAPAQPQGRRRPAPPHLRVPAARPQFPLRVLAPG